MLSGLTALRTSGCLRSVSTVWPIALLLALSVSLPFAAFMTTGLVPFAWSGRLSWSRSWASVEPVPGSDRLSLLALPTARPPRARATVANSQTAITNQWCLAHARPSR